MVTIDIQGTPTYGDDTSNSYSDVSELDIKFGNETYHLKFDSVQEIITIRTKEGALIICPKTQNSVSIESDYFGADEY